MLKNSSKLLFLMILMAGTLITVSSSSWMGAWMGLEINLLSFIPLMNTNKNLMSTESSLKYFLIQAMASSVLLFSIIMLMMKTSLNNQINNTEMCFPSMIMFSSLLMKTGAAPFHFWFPGVMEGLSWMNSLMLMTWQKMAPIALMSYFNFKFMFIYPAILSTMVGALGGLNQTSLRKLMAFSSINHIGWMLTALMSDENLWLIYFMMYSFLSSTLIFMFNMFKSYHFNQLFSTMFSSKSLKFILFTNLLSLGGLPPFLGFLPKWLVIQQLTINNQLTIMFLMVILTLIALFFYLRLSFTAFMLNYYENNWIMQNSISTTNMFTLMLMSTTSITGLFIISLIFFNS